MIVSEITNIQKKDTKIYYIETYTAIAIYAILGEEKKGRIEFSVEYKPNGEPDIQIVIVDSIDYPMLTLKMDLKSSVKFLITNNLLPK